MKHLFITDEEAVKIIEEEIDGGDDSGFLVKPSTLLRVFKKIMAANCESCIECEGDI